MTAVVFIDAGIGVSCRKRNRSLPLNKARIEPRTHSRRKVGLADSGEEIRRTVVTRIGIYDFLGRPERSRRTGQIIDRPEIAAWVIRRQIVHGDDGTGGDISRRGPRPFIFTGVEGKAGPFVI